MDRRDFLELLAAGAVVVGVAGCAADPDEGGGDDDDDDGRGVDAGPPAADATPGESGRDAAPADPCEGVPTALVYDTYAQALYLDGTLGPLTGIIYASYIAEGEAVTLDFWHGHGGQQHRFTVTPEHYQALARGERVYITTTEVESHMHELFVDPADPDYRVEGAEPVEVPLEDC